MELLKKITFKAVEGYPTRADLNAAIKAGAEQLPQTMKVLGVTNGTKKVLNGDTGEVYEPFLGDFVAYNSKGEQFASPLLYLPDIASNILAGKLAANQSVEFALEIGCRLPRDGEKAPAGYIYTCRPLIQPQRGSTLERLAIAAGLLEAPVEPPQKADTDDFPGEEAITGAPAKPKK